MGKNQIPKRHLNPRQTTEKYHKNKDINVYTIIVPLPNSIVFLYWIDYCIKAFTVSLSRWSKVDKSSGHWK